MPPKLKTRRFCPNPGVHCKVVGFWSEFQKRCFLISWNSPFRTPTRRNCFKMRANSLCRTEIPNSIETGAPENIPQILNVGERAPEGRASKSSQLRRARPGFFILKPRGGRAGGGRIFNAWGTRTRPRALAWGGGGTVPCTGVARNRPPRPFLSLHFLRPFYIFVYFLYFLKQLRSRRAQLRFWACF